MDHDAVVVGAGHNGLITAAYLARAGMDVAVLEARPTVGGCAATVEALGARVNVCLCEHTLIRATPILDELDLARHGLRYLDVDPNHLFLTWDGSPPWFGFHDLDRTLDSLAIAHPTQMDGYRRLMRRAIPAARLLLDLACAAPTPGAVAGAAWRSRGRGVAALVGWSRHSAQSILTRYLSEPAVIGALLADAPTTWGVPPAHPGTGPAVLAAAVRHVQLSGRPVGGSGALAEAVGSALRSAGGSIRCGAAVERVLVEAARVRGVRLVGGEEITAPVVVAAVDPRRLHMEWLAGVAPVPGWIAPTPPHGYESKLDVVVDRLSGYRGVHSEIHGVADALVPTATVTPGVDAVAAAHAGMAAGVVAERPVMYANWPSVTDPSLVGTGEHLLGLEVLFTPYRLNGGWEGSAEPERWLEVFARKMEPGFLESVQRWRLVSPADYEADFGLERGFVPSFAGTPLSAVLGRPPELTRYRSPIEGLYLTGGATFPGAGIWGASGRNAAGAVLADR